MVRIWKTPLYFLNTKRLVAEHYETHVAVGALLRGKGAWFKHPQVKRFYEHIGQLVDRHLQQVEELKRRGYTSGKDHKTPIRYVDVYEPYTYSREEMKRDLEILSERQSKDLIEMYV